MQSIRDRLPATNSFVVRTTFLIAAMVTCAGLGLWIHQKYVVASAEWSVRDKTFTELADTAHYGRIALRSAKSNDDIQQQIEKISLKSSGKHDCVILTNPDMEVVHVSQTEELIRKAIPKRLQWISEGEFQTLEAGMLNSSIGPFLGTRWPTKNGWAILARPAAVIVADGESIKETLPAAAGIALLWIAALQAVILYLFFAKLNTDSEKSINESNTRAIQQAEELVRTQDAIIFGLAKLADSRDPETGMHLERISMYATQLATALSRKEKYKSRVTPSFVRLIGISSALHDIGKVGVEDAILRKPGPLTDAERKRMQTHTLIGNECLRQIEQRLGPSNFLQMAREIGLNHHERWDGNGYPNQIVGNQIPLSARIVAIADVYDALANRRVYKPAFSHEDCVKLIREGAGAHFDPELVEVFLEIDGEFASIHRRFGELAPTSAPVSAKAMECLESPTTSENNSEPVAVSQLSEGH